jgi:apolipoprotein D and lipocalin family protein
MRSGAPDSSRFRKAERTMRMPHPLVILGVVAALALAVPAAADSGDPATVAHADVDRFMGRWYEIARMPNRREANCARDVVATYERRSNTGIRVVTVCRNADGEAQRLQGVARIRDGESRAKLELRYAPLALAWLPFLWDDWWILEVAPEYTYMMTGDPARTTLWIYARKPALDDATYDALVAHAAAQGYDVTRLVRTPQTAP